MNAANSPARLGKWTDFTTKETWFVSNATRGYVVLAFVGIWLGFSAKYITRILANFALFIHVRYYKLPPDPGSAPVESTPLLPHRASRAEARQKAEVLAEIYKNGTGYREFVEELWFNRKKLASKHRGYLGLFVLILSAVMVIFIFTSVYAARIQADGPAILASEKCGLWVFDRKRGGDEAATRAGINDLNKETRAGAYAKNCYGKPDPFEDIQCNYLYRSRLSFSRPQYTNECPFQNEICGQNQTVTFTTDTVDASELGINSRNSPTFRRQTRCIPLSMEYPYIQNQTQNGTTTYYYYYGEKPLHDPPLNYTYTTTGDPFDRLAPAYDVFTYTTSSTPTVESYWRPRSELTHPKFSTLTLIFISSLRIYYKEWSNDPIFPADKEVYLEGEKKPWFRNSDPRARPLACINYIEVCLGDGKTCWPMNDHLPTDASNNTISPPPEFWLMYASLLKTDIYNAIEKRLGRGLIAQSKVSQYFSEALGDYHWVDEVERLVATSHARTQINTWSVAKGEDSVHEGKDEYILITPEKIYGNLCGIFKYNPPGYASIRFTPLIFILLSFPTFLFLSREWPWPWNTDSGAHEGAHERPQARGAIQEPSDPVGARSETGEIGTRASDVAGPSGSPSASVPLGSELEIPRPTGPVVRQGTVRGGRTAITPTRESDEIRWEPLVIEKIIEGLVMIARLGWQLVVFLVWKWPLRLYEWLSQTIYGRWIEWLLVSLFRDWPLWAYERLSQLWQNCTTESAADEAEPA